MLRHVVSMVSRPWYVCLTTLILTTHVREHFKGVNKLLECLLIPAGFIWMNFKRSLEIGCADLCGTCTCADAKNLILRHHRELHRHLNLNQSAEKSRLDDLVEGHK